MMFKQKRHYHVAYASKNRNGSMAVTTKMYFWERVNCEHLKSWLIFASAECDEQAIITFFQRIAK